MRVNFFAKTKTNTGNYFPLRHWTDHYFGQFLVTLVVFLSDDEPIFVVLFETMISQACKYVLRPPKPFNVSNFAFFLQLSRSFLMFVCLLLLSYHERFFMIITCRHQTKSIPSEAVFLPGFRTLGTTVRTPREGKGGS